MSDKDKIAAFQEIANRGQQNVLGGTNKAVFDELVSRGAVVVPPQHSPLIDRLKRNVAGSAEAALTFATAAPAQVVGGLEGLATLVYNTVKGEEDALDKAVTAINDRALALTNTPESPEGQAILELVSKPFEYFDQITQGAGNIALQATDSPAAATAVKTGLDFLPGLIGIRNTPAKLRQRYKDVKTMKQEAGDFNINLNDSPTAMAASTIKAAERISEGRAQAAQDMATVQSAVKNAKQARMAVVNSLYDEAREVGDTASIGAERMGLFKKQIDESLKDFDTADMSTKLRNRLKEVNLMASMPSNYSVKLNSLANFRKRLNKNKSNDPAEATAIGVVKGQLDSFLEDSFNADMIKGNPQAVDAWKKATAASRKLKEDFSDNRVIKKLAEQEATPEQIKSWVLGASSVGAKKEAGAIVTKLNEILGKESPAMNGLRNEVVFDIMEPLLREAPSPSGFISKHDNFVRNNPTVMKELFGDSVGELTELRKFAAAALNNKGKLNDIDFDATAARLVWGNSLAKNAAQLSLLTRLLKGVRGSLPFSDRKAVIADFLGYNPRKGMIPLGGPAATAGIEGLQDLQQPTQ